MLHWEARKSSSFDRKLFGRHVIELQVFTQIIWMPLLAGESKRGPEMCGFIMANTVSVSHIYCKYVFSSLCLTTYCNSPLTHKLTSPPAALSLETPARWSFSSSLHLLPSFLKSPYVLFSPFFPPYLLIILFLPSYPPLSVSLSHSLSLCLSLSL